MRKKNKFVITNDEATINKMLDEPTICPIHASEIESRLPELTESLVQKIINRISETFLLYVDEQSYEEKYGIRRWNGLMNSLKENGNCVFCMLKNTTLLDDIVKFALGD